MTRFGLTTIALISLVTITETAAADPEPKSLFNGKDLTGWHVDVPHLDDHPDAKPTFFSHGSIKTPPF